MGVTVVASRVGGTPEVVEHGYNGILIDQPDPRLYADAILKLSRDTDMRRSMREAGKATVGEKFTPEVLLREYLALYEDLVR